MDNSRNFDSKIDGRRGKSRVDALFLSAFLGGGLEVDLHGMYVEDALEKVKDIISEALVNGEGVVRIVHGSGTGILRGKVREYLNKLDLVEEWRPGEGSFREGVTVVVLR